MVLTNVRRGNTPYHFSLKSDKGFTLIELLAVAGIIVLITSLILVNNNKFGGKILLENLAYDVALSIRQAQVYGISVRQFEGGFTSGYGVYFNMTSQKAYSLFGDKNGDGLWNPGTPGTPGEDVKPSPYSIERGYHIYKLCAPRGANASTCTAVNRLDIVFRRPEPDAYIRRNGLAAVQESARIVLRSPRGDEASVVVHVTGQISVE